MINESNVAKKERQKETKVLDEYWKMEIDDCSKIIVAPKIDYPCF